jgi:hypothetical protein
MAASAVDRQHVKRVELAVECVSIADEVDRLLHLATKRVAVLRSEARELAGELDGVGERA